MASSKRKKDGKSPKRPRLTYFFLNGDLHRKLEINRGRDRLVAWNYPKGKAVTYNYTDTLKFKEPAFTTSQVCAMLDRGRTTVELSVVKGMIAAPQHTYTLDENRRMYKHMWHEKDILALLEYLSSIHQGRPRKDGRITAAADLPTPREVRAMIRHEGETLGVLRDGQFIPTWRAKEI